ncbi:hypothetical protein ACWGBV_17330 [Streptomyces sp. NPDC055051]
MGKLRKSVTAAAVAGLFFGGAGVAVADSWKSVHVDHVFFDGAVLETQDAQIQACHDRGSLRPDNCSHLREFRRR